MRRIWKGAASGVITAAALGAYLYWLHDWRPSCSNVPSAAAAAEWLNSLSSKGPLFKADQVACAEGATFYEARQESFRDPGPRRISVHLTSPPRAEDFAKLKDLPRLRRVTFILSKTEPGYADAAAAGLGQYKALEELEWSLSDRFTGAGVRRLAGLANLEVLDIKVAIGDGAEGFERMPRLREMKLWDTTLGPAGIASIGNLRALERLSIQFAGAEGGLALFARLPALRYLSLGGAPVGDEQIASLAGAPALQTLEIWRASIGPDGFAGIGRLPKVEGLVLRYMVRAEGFDRLASSATLTSLTISESNVADAAAAGLGAVRSLQGIAFSETKVGNATAAALARLPRLERLYMHDTNVTDEGVRALAAAPELKQLYLFGLALTDEVVADLARFPKLREVYLQGTKVTEAGLARLKAAKPDLKVAP